MYGLDTTRTAAEQLKSLYGGKGQMKLKLFISVKGIKLFDQQSMVRQLWNSILLVNHNFVSSETLRNSKGLQYLVLHFRPKK